MLTSSIYITYYKEVIIKSYNLYHIKWKVGASMIDKGQHQKELYRLSWINIFEFRVKD
jgi:hypothetical protein